MDGGLKNGDFRCLGRGFKLLESYGDRRPMRDIEVLTS